MAKFDHTKAIFVFGSNEGGWHGAGAAKFALDKRGAILRQAEGLQGRAYAIPTKDETIKHTLPLDKIQRYVDRFVIFADTHREHQFQVTRIGCGLAGLRDEDIAPMFDMVKTSGVPNVWFDGAWLNHIGIPEDRIWGTF